MTEKHPNKLLIFPKAGVVELTESEIVMDSESDKVLVSTEYSLISPGTELAMYTGTHVGISDPGNKFAKYPFRPGYVVVGRVVDAISGVPGFTAGDRVIGIGTHAKLNVLSGTSDRLPVLKLDEGQEPREALFARLAAISSTALLRSHPTIGSRVVVLGLGLIGNLAAQLFSVSGCRVVGVDVDPARLEVARQCGLREVVNSMETPDLAAASRAVFDGEEPDIVVEATGVPELVNTALELVVRQGEVVLLGSPRGRLEIEIYAHIHRKGVVLTGAHEELQGVRGLPSRRETMTHVLNLLRTGGLTVAPLITRELAPEDAAGAYEALLNHNDRALGMIFRW